MARCILIIDSATGELIDAAGNGREGGRYKKFVRRLLSRDTNPVLDYGGNGGDTLIVAKNGGKGKAIYLKAETVYVSDDLKIGDRTVAEIAAAQAKGILNDLVGTSSEITVKPTLIVDPETHQARDVIQISLADAVLGRLEMIDAALGKVSRFVTKEDLTRVIADLKVEDTDTLEEVKGTLRVLLQRLNELVSGSSSDSSNSAEG